MEPLPFIVLRVTIPVQYSDAVLIDNMLCESVIDAVWGADEAEELIGRGYL